MSRPSTDERLSDRFDSDFTWRLKEFSDLKDAIRVSSVASRSALLRAPVAMLYAHWEGYVRFCADGYFDYVTIRRHRFSELESQLYANYFLARIGALSSQRMSLHDRCALVNDIVGSRENRFSRINKNLIDTGSNLTSRALQNICVVCSIDFGPFDADADFIDRILVKRRNHIAHGNEVYIRPDEVDDLVSKVVSLMRLFRNALENKVYQRSYLVTTPSAAASL